MVFTTFLLTVVSVFIVEVTGNPMCVCNKDNAHKIDVFNSTDSNSTVIGHLNMHQCRTYVNASAPGRSWLGIQLNGEIGYIQNDADFLLEAECPGTDHLPATNIPLTSPMVSASTPSHSGCMKQHVSTALTGKVALCPANAVLGAKSHCRLLTQHAHNCYEFTRGRVSWAHAKQICTARGGHLVTIHNAQENTYLHHILTQLNYTHRVWVGLQDQNNEGHFHWVTGEKVSYTNWSNHSTHDRHNDVQDCVVMLVSGEWEDQVCGGHGGNGGHAYICEYKVHNSGSSIIG